MKMKNKKNLTVILISTGWIVLGVVLNVLYKLSVIDSFWSGFGGGLIAVGVLRIIRSVKYITDAKYKESVDIEVNDERNKFISGKAWAWSGYTFVITSAVATIVLMILGYKDYAYFCSGAMCFMVAVYYISRIIISRKY